MAIVATPFHGGAADVLGGGIVGVLVPPFVVGARPLVIAFIAVIRSVVVSSCVRVELAGGEPRYELRSKGEVVLLLLLLCSLFDPRFVVD